MVEGFFWTSEKAWDVELLSLYFSHWLSIAFVRSFDKHANTHTVITQYSYTWECKERETTSPVSFLRDKLFKQVRENEQNRSYLV